MRLTNVLFHYIKRWKVPGNIFLGKHQVILPVTSKMKVACVKEIIEQKKNLLLIQNAYINEEVEKHLDDIEIEYEKMNALEEKDKKIQEKMLKDLSIEDHLNHLNVSKNWE